MMDTMTKSQDLYSQALDSSGTMMEVQEKYMDSLEGKMGRLTATTQTFWSNIINSNAVKGGVSALTSFIDVLNDLTDIFGGTLVGIVGFSALLYPLATKIMTAVGATSLWSGAQAILNAVISANPLLVFITACVGTIAVVKALVSHIETAQDRIDKMDEASQKFNDTVSTLNKAEVDLHTWGQLQRQLEDGNLTLEERNNIIDQSDTLESQLGTAIEGADGILKNNVLTWEEKKALILECIEAQKQANAKDLNDELASQKKYEKINEKLKENIQLYKDLGEAMNDPNLDDYTKNQYLEQMDNLAGKIKEGYTEVQKYNGIIDDSGEYLDIYGRKHLDVSEDTRQFVDGLLGIGNASGDAEEGLEGISDGLEEMSEEARQAKEHLDTMCDGVSDWNVDGVIDDIDEGFGRIISGAESVMDAVDELTKKFDEHKNGIELANTAVEEFNENGYLTGDTWDDIVSSGDMDLIAGLWLEAGQAKEYYKNLSEGWQQEREDTANAEIMLSALEKGLIDENSEAYQIAKQAEIDASNRAKAEKIAILDQEKNEAIAIETIKINEKYNKMLEDANNSYEIEMIKLEKQRAIAEARQGIEEQYSTDRQAIEQAQTEGVISEYERQKQANQDKCDDISFKEQQLQTEFEKTTEAKKTAENGFVTNSQTNMASYVATAGSAYRKDASNFAGSITTKMSSLNRFKGALAGAVTAVNNFNNMAIRTPNFNTGRGSSGGGGTGGKRSAINESEFSPVAPMSADSEGTVTPMSAEGGSSEGGNGGTAPIEPFAIPGGTQHGASSASGSTLGSTSGKITQLAGSIDSLTSSVKNLTSATKSNASATKSSNSETEKEIKNIEIETDRYYKLNDVLEDYENYLKEIEDMKVHASDRELVDINREEIATMQDKINVLKRLQSEQEKELSEARATLQQNGFLIDSYGNLTNSQERLVQLVDWANSSSNDVKEANQEQVKYLEEVVDLYTKLANDSIPDTIDKIRDLQNEIKTRAIDEVSDMRDRLLDALKEERKTQKEQEIGILDARIKELQAEIDSLEDDDSDLYDKRTKLETELRKWQKDDSAYSIKKQQELQKELDELNKEIKKTELQKQIDEIENTKDAVEETYDKMLEERQLYEDVNQMMVSDNQTEMLRLLESYGDDYTDIGVLYGKNFTEAFLAEIRSASDALHYLKGEGNYYTVHPNSAPENSATKPTTNPTPTSQPTQVPQTSNIITKGSRVKVTDPNTGIYVNSSTGTGSGTWKGAGVSANDTLYVVNASGDRVALARTQNINDVIGWIDKKKVQAFATGGYTGEFKGGRLAMLHEKEYVLNSAQTQAWLKLVPMLTELVKIPFLDMTKLLGELNNSTTNHNSRVYITNDIDINNSSDVDMKKTEKSIDELLKQQLRKYGKIK